MQLSRRRFLECAAGSALAMATLPRVARPVDRRRSPLEWSMACAVLDLERDCCLPESLAGYDMALAELGVRAVRADARSVPGCATLVVPAALRISPAAGAMIRRSLDDGATVILESGAGFADAASADFKAHRGSLREELQLHVASPISLWPKRAETDGMPYVEYSWPIAARIRDFSRVVPLSSQEPRDMIIARVVGTPVALKRRSGTGTLIFLGSPLGPALRCGDAQAREWLASVLPVAGTGTSAR